MRSWGAKFLLLALAAAFLTGCPCPNRKEVNWVTMGTTASVKWSDTRDSPVYMIREDVPKDFAKIEKLLNAHDPASEISRLAALSDAEIVAKCNAEVRPCYEAAFRLRELTDGLFNPRWRGPGTMDLGAIAKGFAVDYSLRGWVDCQLLDYWRILVDLGGNLRAVDTEGWKVGVKDGGSFMLAPGEACATSATYFRGGHIHDGRTGAVVSNSVHSATVVHPSSAMWADGLSTVMFLLGPDKGREFLREKASSIPDGKRISVLWLMADGSENSLDPERRFK